MGEVMGGFLAAIAGGTAALLFFGMAGAVLLFYAFAFIDGAALWFGWEGWWVAMLFVFGLFFFRHIGVMVAGIIGGYGAYYGWDWPLWAVVIVFFPGLAFLVAGVFLTALGALFGSFRRA
jgi:hypothetical protein